MKFFIPVLLCFALLAGCSLTKFNENKPLIQLTVQAATARVLHERPNWKDDVEKISAQAMAYVNGTDEVSVAGLADYVKAQIPWDDMLPEEQAVAVTLLDVVQSEIERALAERGVKSPGETKVIVGEIVGWIHGIAAL